MPKPLSHDDDDYDDDYDDNNYIYSTTPKTTTTMAINLTSNNIQKPGQQRQHNERENNLNWNREK